MSSKSKLMEQLLGDIRSDSSCQSIKPPLINQFSLHKDIPNRWFDWVNRVNSPIMIIGQDWGPYVHLKKYIEDPSQDHFASSRTEKFIINALNSIDPVLINSIFFTVAVVFTRTGSLFRGNQNYNESKSFEVSFPYVSRQIDIVNPRVIFTLGGLAFSTVNRHFNLNSDNRKLSEIVDRGAIDIAGTTIIPSYHPAAFVAPGVQLQSWHTLKDYLLKLSQ